MTSLHLLTLYLMVGAALAFVTARRTNGSTASRAASAFVALLVWPLWAPIALAPPREPTLDSNDLRAAKLHAALDSTVEAAAGSSFETLLSSDAVSRIRKEIDRAATRIAELRNTLAQPGFDPNAAESRLSDLERSNANPRALATARLHRDGVFRLARLHREQSLAFEELGDALAALRAQFVLARVAGHGKDDIVSDLWARVEGLGAAFADEAINEQVAEPDAFAREQDGRTHRQEIRA